MHLEIYFYERHIHGKESKSAMKCFFKDITWIDIGLKLMLRRAMHLQKHISFYEEHICRREKVLWNVYL